jgi:hypothetical protein
MVTVAVIRQTVLLTDAEVESWSYAAQVATSRDFARHWNDATIVFVPPGHPIPQSTATSQVYQLWFRDHTDEDGALGYHDARGAPIAYVFVADDLADGSSWTVTASHELWEMLADPAIDRTATEVAGGVTWRVPIEVADCCEDDRFAYEVTGPDGVSHKMSAFATPAWFDAEGQAPFTFPPVDSITAPFELAEGGYIGRQEVAPTPGAWTQLFAQEPGKRQVKKPYSRTMRRFTRTTTADGAPQDKWDYRLLDAIVEDVGRFLQRESGE